jgi:hypothetical protein
VELVGISGTKKKAYLKAKIDKHENKSKIKKIHIRELYRGISYIKKDY